MCNKSITGHTLTITYITDLLSPTPRQSHDPAKYWLANLCSYGDILRCVKLQLPKWTAVFLLLFVLLVTVLPYTNLDPTTLQDVNLISMLCMVLSLTAILRSAKAFLSSLAHARVVELSFKPSLPLLTSSCLRC